MDSGFAHAYGVELLYTEAPRINKGDLLAALREYCGNVEPLDRGEDSDLLAFVHIDHMVQYTDRAAPAQAVLFPSSDGNLPGLQEFEPALQQTWDWPGARAALEQCRAMLLVTDMLASGLDYKTRLHLFHGVVTAAVELTGPSAIHWRPSQRIVDPREYLRVRHAESPDPIYPAINVRFFNVQDRAPGEGLMDTVGLAALGLADVQCHFVGLEPNDVANVVGNTAHYLFDSGDVIEDGHTVSGIRPQDKWRCQHEDALAPPERVVLDLNPGDPYAAGNRD